MTFELHGDEWNDPDKIWASGQPNDGDIGKNFDDNFYAPPINGAYTYVGNGANPMLLKGSQAVKNPDGSYHFETKQSIVDPYGKINFGDDYWVYIHHKMGGGEWIRVSRLDWEKLYAASTHPKWKPGAAAQTEFTNRIDTILTEHYDPCSIKEGMIISINKLISDTIRVPEGQYIIATVNSNKCMLVPTSESQQQTFEVFKRTLAGFFNPEIHKKTVNKPNGQEIAESNG